MLNIVYVCQIVSVKLMMLATVVIVLLINVQRVDGDVTSPPVNAAVVVGNTVTFSCTTTADNKIRWQYYRGGTGQPILVWNTARVGINDTRFRVDTNGCKSGRTCNVIITGVATGDSGIFVCLETGKSAQYAASLIVLASGIQCAMNDDKVNYAVGSTVRLGCRIGYSGSWTPTLQCDAGVVTSTPDETMTLVSRTFAVQALTAVNDWTITCRVFFDQNSSRSAGLALPSTVFSDISPGFTSSWSSPRLHVGLFDKTTTVQRTLEIITTTVSAMLRSTTRTTTTEQRPPETIDIHSTVDELTTKQQSQRTAPIVPPESSLSVTPLPTERTMPLEHIVYLTLGLVGFLVIIIIIGVLIFAMHMKKRADSSTAALVAGAHAGAHYAASNELCHLNNNNSLLRSTSSPPQHCHSPLPAPPYSPGSTLARGQLPDPHYSVAREERRPEFLAMMHAADDSCCRAGGSQLYEEIGEHFVTARGLPDSDRYGNIDNTALKKRYEKLDAEQREAEKSLPPIYTQISRADGQPGGEFDALGAAASQMVKPNSYAAFGDNRPSAADCPSLISSDYLTPAEINKATI